MPTKILTLSIIIPAYNEERYLKDCLNSIAAQTIMPDEVIVIDNNSTDKTAQIAQSFSFVKLLTESRQGVVYARDKGFNAAHSDIIGRINADSLLRSDWVARVKYDFAHGQIAAVTGLGITRTIPGINSFRTPLWSWAYYIVTEGYFRVRILWGANMAISRKVWQKIRKDVWHDTFAHEDQDLSLLVAKYGGVAIRDAKLLIYNDGRSFHHWPKFKKYMLMRWYTKSYHRKRSTLRAPESEVTPRLQAFVMHWVLFVPSAIFIVTSLVFAIITFPFRRFTKP
jgi:glycosyltransferase involved in cell wall biosynthesis